MRARLITLISVHQPATHGFAGGFALVPHLRTSYSVCGPYFSLMSFVPLIEICDIISEIKKNEERFCFREDLFGRPTKDFPIVPDPSYLGEIGKIIAYLVETAIKIRRIKNICRINFVVGRSGDHQIRKINHDFEPWQT